MTVTVGVAQAHNRLSELIDQALAGVDVIIAKRATPAVRLTPVNPGRVEAQGKRLAAMWDGWLADRGPGRTDDQIAADVEADRDSWDRGWYR